MKIGIDASRAFLEKRTGIEQYSYQIIKNLRDHLADLEVVLYVRRWNSKEIDFALPKKWSIQKIPYIYGWTQVGLALEMLLRPVDVFFSPAHTIAVIHPKKTVVTVHGLEYEHCPYSYSLYARWFHRFFIKRSCCWATKVIAVSQKTKNDLIDLYHVDGKKITVIYNGFEEIEKNSAKNYSEYNLYLFYIGRIEKRKNIAGIIKAFEIVKRDKKFTGKLLLAGGPGHGYEEIGDLIKNSEYSKDIVELGFVNDQERGSLLRGAEIFLFPSFCEGFGIPVLEAQSVGTPVITSNLGPLNEVAGNDEILVDPNDANEIADKICELISKNEKREEVIKKGMENVHRFSWQQSARETAQLIEKVAEKQKREM